MPKTTTVQLIRKPFQFAEEVTEGTFETSAVTYNNVGVVSKVSIKIDNTYREVSQIGAEDLVAILRGRKVSEVSIVFKVVDGTKTFLKYLLNAANFATPANTISKSLSFLFSFYLDGVENYVKIAGARCRTATISGGVDKDWEITAEFECNDIPTPTTSAPVGPTLQTTPPSGNTWDWLSGTATPASFAGSGIDMQEVSITVNRNTPSDYTMGNRKPYSNQPHGRRMGGTFKVLYTSTTLESNMEADTGGTLSIIMKDSSGYTLTFTNCKLTNLSYDQDTEDTQAIGLDFGWKAKGFTELV